MELHLVRSPEFSRNRFSEIIDLVKCYKGPVNFISKEDLSRVEEPNGISDEWDDTIQELPFVSWDALFGECQAYRKSKRPGKDNIVVLMTDRPNEMNWFSAGDESGQRNFFIHTGEYMWKGIIEADPRYPVVYELALIILQSIGFENHNESVEMAHHEPRGCIFDMCIHKSDIHFKLRTADICPDCMNHFTARKCDPKIIRQVLDMMEGIREHVLFRSRYKIFRQPSRMVLNIPARRLEFTDLGGVSVKLSPSELRIYRLFFNHPEGLSFDDLLDSREIRKEFFGYFSPAGPNEVLLAAARNDCDRLLANEDERLTQHISRIKRKITLSLGEELAAWYIIAPDPEPTKRIKLPRELVTFCENPLGK